MFIADVFNTYRCRDVVNDTTHYVVNADGPRWPRDGFCTILPTDPAISTDSYVCTASLYNYDSGSGSNSGHPGIAYNVQDENNFDAVFFR